jgi:putative ABC transport system substrate-binding protein
MLSLGREQRMQYSQLKRREFISLLGGSVAWPLVARAQQSAMPVVGYLNPTAPDAYADLLRAFRQGLKESGFAEGENVAIEYRWAENQIDRLPALAAELVRRQVAVIATMGGPPAAFAAKATTTTIPIVFLVGEDPARLGLVASLARPDGNLTGVNFFNTELAAKRLELLRELLPMAKRVAVLVNPAEATNTESVVRDAEQAAPAMGLQIQVLNASTSREIDAAFTTVVRERPDALFVGRSHEAFAHRYTPTISGQNASLGRGCTCCCRCCRSRSACRYYRSTRHEAAE